MKRNCEYTPFGKQVKIKMIEQNLTSKELARMIGKADSTICDVISGRNKRELTRWQIAQILGIDMELPKGKQEKGSYV